jgi:hypothetical protein
MISFLDDWDTWRLVVILVAGKDGNDGKDSRWKSLFDQLHSICFLSFLDDWNGIFGD